MDTIDIVISIIVVAAYLFFNYKKKEKSNNSEPVEIPKIPESVNIPFEPKFEKKRTVLNTSMEEIGINSSKKENYFTYEETNKIEAEFYNYDDSFVKAKTQSVDNEDESFPMLTLESGEIINGIIYGEILKRPNY
jgi:hypothetical protein